MSETVHTSRADADAVAIAAFTTDTEGRVQWWSPDAEQLFGYSKNEIAGQSLTILAAADEDDAAREASPYPTLKRFRRKDGTEFVGHQATVRLRTSPSI